MSDMRICYDHQAFSAGKYGGISRYFVEVALRVNRYSKTKVRIIAPLYRSKLLAAKSDEIPVLGLPFTCDFKGAARIAQQVDTCFSSMLSAMCRPDIVHETYYSRHSTSTASAKTVITVYDMIEELLTGYFDADKKTTDQKKAAFSLRKAAFSRADHLICISERTRADLIRLYEVDPQKTSVVYLACSLAAPSEPVATAKTPYFLYVGNRKGYKNFLGLLAAFAASKLFQTHKLVCFGGGELTGPERERVIQLKIPSDRVVVANGDDEVLSRYYAAAEAFVCPSLYEGFGIPLLEAMECECPVVCNNAGSMPEIAGEAAVYFDARDTQSISNVLLSVAGSPEERLRMIAKGKERVKQFSWDICAQQTYDVYTRLLTNQ